jgi:hypothetical protein
MLIIVYVFHKGQTFSLIVFFSFDLRLWTPWIQYVSSSCTFVLLTYQLVSLKANDTCLVNECDAAAS